MKNLARILLSILILISLISGCAPSPKNTRTPTYIAHSMLDLPAMPEPQYEKLAQDEALTSELNSEIFIENVTKMKNWAKALYLKYEAVRAQNQKLKALQDPSQLSN